MSGHFSEANDNDPLLYATIQHRTYKASVVRYQTANIDVFIHQSSGIGLDRERFLIPIIDYTHPSSSSSSSSLSQYVAPMSGRIVKVLVSKGQTIEKGQALIIMEAMKMEHMIRATHRSIVDNILYKEGDFVEGNTVMIRMEPEIALDDKQRVAKQQA